MGHTHTPDCCQRSSTGLILIQKHPDTQLISCGLTSQTGSLIIRQLHNYILCHAEWVMDRIGGCCTCVSKDEAKPFSLGKRLLVVARVLRGCIEFSSIAQTDVNKQETPNAKPVHPLWTEASHQYTWSAWWYPQKIWIYNWISRSYTSY